MIDEGDKKRLEAVYEYNRCRHGLPEGHCRDCPPPSMRCVHGHHEKCCVKCPDPWQLFLEQERKTMAPTAIHHEKEG